MTTFDSKFKITLHNSSKQTTLEYSELRKVVLTLRAINHDLRKKIVELLKENKSLNVTAIYVKLRVEQSVASQHLRTLRDVGIVNTIREGKFIFYTLNHERLKQIGDFVNKLVKNTEVL